MRTKRVIATVSALAMAGLGLAACGSGGADDGTLRLSLGEPKSLIPPNIGETEGGEIADHVYTGLYDYNADGTLKPIIAESEPESKDNVTWTIKIKDGFTFQNGEKITADTFVKSWNFAVNGKNANAGAHFFEKIDGFDDTQGEKPKKEELTGLKAVDDKTLEVKLAKPFVGFPTTLGYSAFFPMADECLEDTKACNEKPIGNGMYEFDGKWKHKQGIKLKAWKDFAGDKPKVDKIDYKIYTGDNTCWEDFEAGNIDICAPTAEDYETAKAKYGEELLEKQTPNSWGMGFPTYDDRFSDPKVRKAFSMAVDRKTYIKGLFQGRYTEAHSYIPEAIPGYKENSCGEACEFDKKGAKKLLDEAGFDTGEKITMWVNSGPGEDYLKVLGDQLSENLGIKYEMKTLEWPDFLEKKQNHEITGPFLTGWVPDYPLNENYMAPLYGHGPENDFGYDDAKFEKLLAEGDQAADIDAALKKYQEAEAQLVEGLPMAPIWSETTATALGDRIDRDSYKYNEILGSYDYQKIALA